MNRFAKTFTLSACALAASLLISACGGGTAGDTVAPTVTITSAASTVAGNVTFTFKFSESVGTSFSVEDLVVTNGTPGGLTKVDATTYTVDVTPGASAPSVSLAAGKVYDLVNNPNVAAANNTFDRNAVTIVGTGNTGACTTTSTANCFGFEDTSVLFEAFEGLASAGTVVDPAGGTNKVLQLVKVPFVDPAGSRPWAGVTLHTSPGTGNASKPFTSPAVDFASNKVITLRVLSPAAGKPITLKVENSANPGVNMLKTVNTTKAHEWETLTFDFTTPTQSSGVANAFVAGATFDVISLFPDYMTAEIADVSYYFDELTYAIGAAGGAVTAPTVAAAIPTALAANVLSVYSDAYTPTAGINFFPNWGQNTVDAEVQVAGNNTRKYTNFNYEGITFAPIDVSGMTKLHIDVWTPDMTALDVFILSGAPAAEQSIQVQPTKSGWNSFDIDLAGFTNPNKAAIKEMKLVATGGTTMYFDNLYFWKAATAPVSCGTTEPTCAPTTVIPAGAVTIYSDAVTTAGFDPRPNWGQSVTETEVTVASNKSLKYTFQGGGFGAVGAYEGITWETNPLDVSGKGKLHLDLWSADLTSLKISLIGGGESAVTQAVNPGSWNSVDIDLSQFPGATNKAAVIQLKLESAAAGAIYVDNIYFWGTASATGGTTTPADMGSGGAQTMTMYPASGAPACGLPAQPLCLFATGDYIFAGDYKGGVEALTGRFATFVGAQTVAPAVFPSALAGGAIGHYNDPAIDTSPQKLAAEGWVTGTASDYAGSPNFFYQYVLTKPAATFASSYMGVYVNAPQNGTVDVSARSNMKLRIWGPGQMYQNNIPTSAYMSLNPALNLTLAGPKIAGCASGSGGSEITKNLTAISTIGGATEYTVSLAGWTLVGAGCGGDASAADVLKHVARVVVNVPGTSFNFTNPNGTAGVDATAYATGVNIGAISFK
jgi:hypothetical protein